MKARKNNIHKEDDDSMYSDAYSQNSYENHQMQNKDSDSMGRSTTIKEKEKYFRSNIPEPEDKEPVKLRSGRNRTKKKSTTEKETIREDNFDNYLTLKTPTCENDPLDDESIGGGCCKAKINMCLIF